MDENKKSANIFALSGRPVLFVINKLGRQLLFLLTSCLRIFSGRHQFINIVQQVYFIGARSTLIVALVALFTGMVLGLQLYNTLVQFGSVGALGSAVSLTLVRELGPVLTAIMITARAGSAMTSEIGVQRITEQIDALYTMGVDPIRHLVSPRIVAALISCSLLTVMFDLIGIVGAYFTGVMLLGLDSGTYFYRVQSSIDMEDINDGLVKALVFAVLVTSICCYQGYFTHFRKDAHGAKAVGASTTTAVVASCVVILIADYIVTSFLL
jgi:phospholipid/cholesterol/gamma-HCH transport system permease protein